MTIYFLIYLLAPTLFWYTVVDLISKIWSCQKFVSRFFPLIVTISYYRFQLFFHVPNYFGAKKRKTMMIFVLIQSFEIRNKIITNEIKTRWWHFFLIKKVNLVYKNRNYDAFSLLSTAGLSQESHTAIDRCQVSRQF